MIPVAKGENQAAWALEELKDKKSQAECHKNAKKNGVLML